MVEMMRENYLAFEVRGLKYRVMQRKKLLGWSKKQQSRESFISGARLLLAA
jgi:hypothetical protein